MHPQDKRDIFESQMERARRLRLNEVARTAAAAVAELRTAAETFRTTTTTTSKPRLPLTPVFTTAHDDDDDDDDRGKKLIKRKAAYADRKTVLAPEEVFFQFWHATAPDGGIANAPRLLTAVGGGAEWTVELMKAYPQYLFVHLRPMGRATAATAPRVTSVHDPAYRFLVVYYGNGVRRESLVNTLRTTLRNAWEYYIQHPANVLPILRVVFNVNPLTALARNGELTQQSLADCVRDADVDAHYAFEYLRKRALALPEARRQELLAAAPTALVMEHRDNYICELENDVVTAATGAAATLDAQLRWVMSNAHGNDDDDDELMRAVEADDADAAQRHATGAPSEVVRQAIWCAVAYGKLSALRALYAANSSARNWTASFVKRLLRRTLENKAYDTLGALLEICGRRWLCFDSVPDIDYDDAVCAPYEGSVASVAIEMALAQLDVAAVDVVLRKCEVATRLAPEFLEAVRAGTNGCVIQIANMLASRVRWNRYPFTQLELLLALRRDDDAASILATVCEDEVLSEDVADRIEAITDRTVRWLCTQPPATSDALAVLLLQRCGPWMRTRSREACLRIASRFGRWNVAVPLIDAIGEDTDVVRRAVCIEEMCCAPHAGLPVDGFLRIVRAHGGRVVIEDVARMLDMAYRVYTTECVDEVRRIVAPWFGTDRIVGWCQSPQSPTSLAVRCYAALMAAGGGPFIGAQDPSTPTRMLERVLTSPADAGSVLELAVRMLLRATPIDAQFIIGVRVKLHNCTPRLLLTALADARVRPAPRSELWSMWLARRRRDLDSSPVHAPELFEFVPLSKVLQRYLARLDAEIECVSGLPPSVLRGIVRQHLHRTRCKWVERLRSFFDAIVVGGDGVEYFYAGLFPGAAQ